MRSYNGGKFLQKEMFMKFNFCDELITSCRCVSHPKQRQAQPTDVCAWLRTSRGRESGLFQS